MQQAKSGSTVVMNYRYNGRGERTRAYLASANTYTLYDEAGHWLGDYGNNGAVIQQAIWMDDLPVGVATAAKTHYLQPDHLGTPRAVIDPASNKTIWSWSIRGEAFGTTAPNEDPDQNGQKFVFNLRFPGQRYDAASGLNYNYFRDYDPTVGRYVQSDPIGLDGGPSTYGYVDGTPCLNTDPYGLWKVTISIYDGVGGAFFFGSDAKTGGFIGLRFGVGAGGGVAYEPKGNAPGADPCSRGGVGLGLFGEIGGTLGPISAGIGAAGGGKWTPFDERKIRGYGEFQPQAGLENGRGIKASASAGVELTLYGGKPYVPGR
jgi:RHS repeat-associated protein